MAASDLLDPAFKEADQLSHGWIGTEHLVLAVLREGSVAGKSLRACGVDHDSYRRAVEGLPQDYRRRWEYQSGGKVVAVDAQLVLARAEGIAAGLGSSIVASEHVVLSLLWERAALVALRLLQRLGATRADILQELKRGGVTLRGPMPAHPSWGAWRRIPSPEFERLTADLRRRGVLYRYSPQDGEVLVSIVEPRSPVARAPGLGPRE